MIAIPERGSIRKSIIDHLLNDGAQSADELHLSVPMMRRYKPKFVTKILTRMVDEGYIVMAGEDYLLSDATLDAIQSKKYQGVPATPREGNVFAETNGAIAEHFAGMRRALMGRLA